jgi:hypothetical protein
MGTWGANNLVSNIVYTPGVTKTIAIDARANVPLLFLRILGQNMATVSASGTATRTDSRIELIIDNSPSMSGMIGAAKSYAAGFVQRFTTGPDELGLVVLDSSAYVAYPPANPQLGRHDNVDIDRRTKDRVP